MHEWHSLPHAPSSGTPLGLAQAIGPDGREFVFGEGLHAFRLLVLRLDDGTLRGFINRCPHYSLPLNVRPGEFLTRDGTRLMCRQHLALFDRATGACLSGACEGTGLTQVALQVQAGEVFIA